MENYKLKQYFFFISAHDNEEDISIVYVPSHLYHMLFELFKVGFYILMSFDVCANKL